MSARSLLDGADDGASDPDGPLKRERICIALDVGAEMGAPWDARRPERGTRARRGLTRSLPRPSPPLGAAPGF